VPFDYQAINIFGSEDKHTYPWPFIYDSIVGMDLEWLLQFALAHCTAFYLIPIDQTICQTLSFSQFASFLPNHH